MPFIPYIVLVLVFACVSILVAQFLGQMEKQRFLKERFVPQKEEEGRASFWLRPLLSPLAPINAVMGSKSFRENLQRRLASAGSPLTVNEYLAFKELLILVIPLVLAVLIGWQRLLAHPILIVVACGLGFIYPVLWLKARIQRRKTEVLRALPNVIDLLILAVDAGLDFMIALRRVIERSPRGPLVGELSRLYQQVQIGRVRRDALKNMAKRLELPEVYSFARTLIQAERMGTPMGEALRTLSEEIRLRRFQRGEQQALKAPIKMLFPLLFCILPVVLILVGGPVILDFVQHGIQFFK